MMALAGIQRGQGGAATGHMEARSTDGPILGVPLTYAELRTLTAWAAAHPTWQAAIRDGLWRWEAPRATLVALAAALRADHPRLAADVVDVVRYPQEMGALSQAEQGVIRRIRQTGTGTVVVTVHAGRPTVSAQRHWRWRAGGQAGWFATQLAALRAACVPQVRQMLGGAPMTHLPPTAEDALERVEHLTHTYATDVAAALADLRAALAPVLEQAAAWPTIEQRLAKLALIERLLGLEPDGAAADPAAPAAPAPAAVPPSATRVWRALEDLARQQALPVPASTLTRRTGLPHRTVRDALRRLWDTGRVVRLGTAPPYQWTVPGAATTAGPAGSAGATALALAPSAGPPGAGEEGRAPTASELSGIAHTPEAGGPAAGDGGPSPAVP